MLHSGIILLLLELSTKPKGIFERLSLVVVNQENQIAKSHLDPRPVITLSMKLGKLIKELFL